VHREPSFGGYERDGRFVFELTGGEPALDFVNTLDERKAEEKERLTGLERIVDWARQAGVLTPEEATSLQNSHHSEAGLLKDAREVRELLFRVFVSSAAGGEPNADLAKLQSWLNKAARRRQLIRRDGRFSWTWGDPTLDPGVILWRILENAAAILTDPERLGRLRVCNGARCAWLFLDYSRRQNRRWCDMSVCGNRAKARRHYRRNRGEAKGKVLRTATRGTST